MVNMTRMMMMMTSNSVIAMGVGIVPNKHLSKRDRHIALKEPRGLGLRGQIFRGLNGTLQ
jgi:hypothetical protein